MYLLMRRVTGLALVGILALAAAGCGGGSETASRVQDDRIFDMLDQYGFWVDIPAYGTVWHPNVSPEWRPYTYGQWIWSDQGWVWVGYEPFAWIVYHYGSWYNDRAYGWVWVPAYDWAPAPVAWSMGDDYIAWAPLPPQGAPLIQPGDPYWEQSWVLVPVAQFRQENVGSLNAAKDSRSGGRVRGTTRTPPDVKKVERLSAGDSTPLKVDFDRVSSEGRDLLRLKLPAYEEKVVQAREEEFRRTVLRGEEQKTTAPAEKRVRAAEPAEHKSNSVDTPKDRPASEVAPVPAQPTVKQPSKVDESGTKAAAPARQTEKPKPATKETKPAPAAKPAPAPKPAEKKEPEPKDNAK